MKDKLSAFWKSFAEKWNAIAKGTKIFIITALCVVIVAAIVLTVILNQKSYTAIYTGLDNVEAGQVVTAINDLGITDVVMGTDGSIRVPAEQADNIRMQLSIQGYPKSTFNFDIWNNGIGMWSTDTEKKVLQVQQLQTHLMNAINTIKGIDNSKVLIMLPQNDNYVISDKKEEPRVSAMLEVRSGYTLTSEQVDGIHALILNSLPGLKKENISVVDSGGELLTGDTGTVEEDALYQSRLNFQERVQKLLEEQLDGTLKKLYKDYTINVNVALNFDKSKSELTIYTPSIAEDGTLGGMIESTTKNEGWGGIGSLSGVVGTTGNSDISPNYPTIEGDEEGEYYYQNSTTVKHLVNTEIKQLEKSGYSIDRITAAVTVDETSMLEAEKETLREVVAFAIGAEVANVTVANYPFVINPSHGNNGDIGIIGGGANTDWMYLLIVSLGFFVLMLLIIAILAGNSRKKKKAKARERAAAAAAAAAEAQAAQLAYETPAEEDEDFVVQKLDEYNSESKGALLRKEIKEFSHTNPDVVAQLIRSLLREEY